MAESTETLRVALAALRALTFPEAYERIVADDPLGLAARVERALVGAACWAPAGAVTLRAARHLAAALRDAPLRPGADGGDPLAAWVDGHVAVAVAESQDGSRASEPREREHWARHLARVAATFGVEDRLGADALALFHALPLDERRLLLLGMDLARTRRTRELDAEHWARFDQSWRGLVRAVLAGPTP